MLKTLTGCIMLFISVVSFSQEYSRVKINTNSDGLRQLSNLGVTVDHGTYKQETFFISDFSAAEIQIMQQHGFNYEILIEDVQKYYVEQNTNPSAVQKNATCSGGSGGTTGFSPATPSNFNLGSMGGYLTYQQMLNELDAMVAQYPTLITAKAPISTFLTAGNRPLYYVKISDSPSTDDATEPKVLYTAIHHAREPMALMETIFYMWYLLENYSTSEEVQYLVNNMQMYFVPCINPDGYVYNETTNPNGGGMWRKNRRLISGSTYGVDLNRNYSYGWGTTGTSSNPSNDTYCGTAAFSEPETQAMRWLVQNNHFITGFNAHTYAGSILFPIGTTTAEFADHHDYFQAEGDHMVQYNGYTAMKSSALYPASGDSDDYMYKVDIGVGQKDTMFVHTPEVGTAFWQPSSEIVATCQEMVFPNLVLAHLPKKYYVVTDSDPSTVATMTGNFNHSAYRLGLENGPVTVSIQPLLNIASVGSGVVHDIDIKLTETGAISYSLNPAIQFGDEIKYILKTDYGLWVRKDTITKTYGALTLQALEDATATTNWTGAWGTTTSTYVSATKSFADSPTGNYSNNTSNKTYTYVPTIDLTNATAAMISYYAKWNIEADYDYVQFQVSTDNGANWIGQCTNYTVPGTSASGSVQPNNEPVYEGVQTSWVLDEVNLSDYLGQSIKVRFIFESDGGQTADGFYFDDFKVMYNVQGPVVTPTASFTATNTTICTGQTASFNDFSTDSPTSWSWSFGDGGVSTDQNPVYSYAAAGTYSVTLTVTNSAGSNSYTATNYITVNQTPTVTMSTTELDNTVCLNGSAVQLSATPVSAVFSGDGVSGSSFDPAIAGVGPHLITATYNDPNGCVGTTQLTMVVESCLVIDELAANGVAVQPNPNNGEFSILGLEPGAQITIHDLNGKLLYSQKAESVGMIVKIDHAEAGIYYLKTIKNGQTYRVKIAVL